MNTSKKEGFTVITDKDVMELLPQVQKMLSDERFLHTLGVMRAAELLGEYCLPGFSEELKAAALLHDVAKELSIDEQKRIIIDGGGTVTDEDELCAPVLHSFAAPYLVAAKFPKYATENILSALRYHTTGSDMMSVFDEIIFLADFIEDTRPYKACIELRDELLSPLLIGEIEENQRHLHLMAIKMIDFTAEYLKKRNKPIHSKMASARKMLECKLLKK